jgi:serine/threonine protein kinase
MVSKNTRRRSVLRVKPRAGSRLAKTRKQRAGRIVFSGSYGCAFRPAVKCKGETARRPGMISKLIRYDFADQEIKLKKRFQPIDPDQEFFYYPEHVCYPDLTPNEEDNLAACRVAPISNSSKDPPVLLLSQDGGDDLAHIQVTSADYPAFFESLLTLFEGLSLIHRKGLVHLDIKPANIVSKRESDGSFKTRMIDLGLSDLIASVVEKPPTVNYAYWPFDLKLLDTNFLSGRERVDDDLIMDFYENLAYNRPLYPYWLYVTSSGSMINESWAKLLIGKIQSKEISKERIVTGVDIFALGRTIAEVYARLTGHLYVRDKTSPAIKKGVIVPRSVNIGDVDELKVYHSELAEKVSRPLYSLITDMTDANPDKRPTAAEAGVRYRRMLPAMERSFEKFPALKQLRPLADPGEPAVPNRPKTRRAGKFELNSEGSSTKEQRS